MADWQAWVLAAVLLMIAEVFAPGFWLACVAIGCVAAGLAGLVPVVGLAGQIIAFAAGTLVSFIGVRPFLVRHFELGSGVGVRTGVDALLGKTGIVSQRIAAGGGEGRVRVEGEDWRGAAVDGSAIEPGTRVIVVQVDGTILMLEKEGDA